LTIFKKQRKKIAQNRQVKRQQTKTSQIFSFFYKSAKTHAFYLCWPQPLENLPQKVKAGQWVQTNRPNHCKKFISGVGESKQTWAIGESVDNAEGCGEIVADYGSGVSSLIKLECR